MTIPIRIDRKYLFKVGTCSFLLIALLSARTAWAATAPEVECFASFDGSELVVRNAEIERRWRVAGDRLQATSLRHRKTGYEWIALTTDTSDPAKKTRFDFAQKWDSTIPHERSLMVELLRSGSSSRGFRFRVFPHASAISMQRLGPATPGAPVPLVSSDASGIEADGRQRSSAAGQTVDAAEDFALAPMHLRLTEVDLADQTDIHNELVQERHWLLQTNESIRLRGNLFVLEDSLTGSGLIFLKEAPLPHARPEKDAWDFEFEGGRRRLQLPENDVGSNGRGYWLTTLVYSGGGSGITRALVEYQRQIRPYKTGRDGVFLSNTWGDRSRDARINQAFLRKEVEAGARLGVDVIQIDDGWQQGRTKNSAQPSGGVWNGFWAADPAFWNVNRERFPDGLQPLITLARTHGMGFGLWFAPDSSNDFANWERDAAQLLEIHRTLGVNYFKIDGVKAISKLSEERLASLFSRVLTESQGEVVFDLDVTAEIRPGYFGAMTVGPLFVENRYTDKHSYWPHQTLRNLWSLAHYVDALRLRVEFLNQTRNTNLYAGDPLAPAEYSPAYLFATTMMANPLGWFETSELPKRYFDEITPLIRTWKQERAHLQSGYIFPIGDSPDGVAWTGFVSSSSDSRDGYVLIFRERNSSDHWSIDLPEIKGSFPKLKLLGGAGSASLRNGRLEVRIPSSLGFAWFRASDAR